MIRRFSLLDAVVLVAYLAGTTAFGIWLGRRQKNARDYFVAGRDIPWPAVMLSVVATETSALTFISIPGLAYIGNLGFLQVVAGYVLGRIGLAFTLLPRYFDAEIVTAYAMLERRFGLATRRFTSIVFMGTRVVAESVRIFATAIPIALILSGTGAVSSGYTMPAGILILGLLTVVYTYKGGMRAVVWTELLQGAIYILGAVAAVVLLGRSGNGGWSAILHSAQGAGKLHVIDWYTGFDRPFTMLAGLLGGAFLSMASHGADQLIVQRLLSSRSLRDAQKAVIGSGVVVFAQMALFLVIGIGLWAHFAGRTFTSPDDIFPTFILDRMPAGLLGLVIAAIIAATMSTLSGTINSLAAAATLDIYLPITGRSADDPRTLQVGKWLALFWGLALTVGALLYHQQGTPAVVIALSVASFTYGGLLGGFFLALFVRRARQRDAIVGMSVGIAAMAIVVFAKQLVTAYPSLAPTLGAVGAIAWPWYVLIGTTITLITGTLSSLVRPRATATPT